MTRKDMTIDIIRKKENDFRIKHKHIDEENRKVKTFELTVPHISNNERGTNRKKNNYQYLETESNDYSIKTQAF